MDGVPSYIFIQRFYVYEEGASWLERPKELGTDMIQSTEYRVLCTEYCVQNTVYRVLCSEYCVQSTVYRVLGTEYWVQSTGYRVLCTEYWVHCFSG